MPYPTTYMGLGLLTAVVFYGKNNSTTQGVIIFAVCLLLIEPLKKWKEKYEHQPKTI